MQCGKNESVLVRLHSSCCRLVTDVGFTLALNNGLGRRPSMGSGRGTETCGGRPGSFGY